MVNINLTAQAYTDYAEDEQPYWDEVAPQMTAGFARIIHYMSIGVNTTTGEPDPHNA